MNLLLDEDSQGRILVRLLRAAGHDVETVFEAGIAGESDRVVLAYAKRTERVLLTRNGRDFLLLHQADRSHFGILVEHQDSDPDKNMSYHQIVTAIGRIEASGWSPQGEFASINPWR
jgi:predicted nuclease of predicted toxin-antitoxin system